MSERERRWKYHGLTHKFLMCWDCHLHYDDPGWVEYVVTNEVWELINPTPDPGGGMLCITCAFRRLEFLNIENPDMWIGGINVVSNKEMWKLNGKVPETP